jgi:hypothetical protein
VPDVPDADPWSASASQELLPVIDAFEAAAGQVKAETEGEQRIAGSYQVGWIQGVGGLFGKYHLSQVLNCMF